MVLRFAIAFMLTVAAPLMVFGQSTTGDSQSDETEYAVGIPSSSDFQISSDTLEFAPPAPTSESTSLTLLDLEGIAFRHNPTLSAGLARIASARGLRTQAGLCPNPVIGYHGTEIGNEGTSGQQGGFISQRFITAGKLELDQAIAGKQVNEVHFQFHAQEQRVLSDVRIRFYEALAAQRQVELTTTLARIGDNLAAASQKLLDARQGTENDLLQAEIRADEAWILLDNANNQNTEAVQRLAAVVGVPQLQVSKLEGTLESNLPDFDWNHCYEVVLGHHPQLNAARVRAERARIRITRAKKEPIPNVDLMVSVRHHNISDSDVANVQLGIPIPVFDRNQGNIHSAQAEWVVAGQEVKRIELELQDRLATVYRRYENARQQANRYRERMLPRAQRSLELVTAGYERGQVEYLTLLTAQQTFLQVNLSYVDSLRELRSSAALIEGQLLSGSLAEQRPLQ